MGEKNFNLPQNLYFETFPLIIRSGYLSGKDISINIQNIEDKTIEEINLEIMAYNQNKKYIESKNFIFRDLNISCNDKKEIKIKFENDQIRFFNMNFKEIIFSNKSIWKNKDNKTLYKIVKDPEDISKKLKDKRYIDMFEEKTGIKAKNLPSSQQDMWICFCSAINKNSSKTCCLCKKDIKFLLNKFQEVLKIQEAEKSNPIEDFMNKNSKLYKKAEEIEVEQEKAQTPIEDFMNKNSKLYKKAEEIEAEQEKPQSPVEKTEEKEDKKKPLTKAEKLRGMKKLIEEENTNTKDIEELQAEKEGKINQEELEKTKTEKINHEDTEKSQAENIIPQDIEKTQIEKLEETPNKEKEDKKKPLTKTEKLRGMKKFIEEEKLNQKIKDENASNSREVFIEKSEEDLYFGQNEEESKYRSPEEGKKADSGRKKNILTREISFKNIGLKSKKKKADKDQAEKNEDKITKKMPEKKIKIMLVISIILSVTLTSMTLIAGNMSKDAAIKKANAEQRQKKIDQIREFNKNAKMFLDIVKTDRTYRMSFIAIGLESVATDELENVLNYRMSEIYGYEYKKADTAGEIYNDEGMKYFDEMYNHAMNYYNKLDDYPPELQTQHDKMTKVYNSYKEMSVFVKEIPENNVSYLYKLKDIFTPITKNLNEAYDSLENEVIDTI